MPVVRKLTADEVQSLTRRSKGIRKAVEAEYDAILSDYTVGEYGVAELSPNDNRLTVRNRLKAAAARRGLALTFRRTKGPQIRFRVLERGDMPATAASSSSRAKTRAKQPEKPSAARGGAVAPEAADVASDQKRSRGRPKKSA